MHAVLKQILLSDANRLSLHPDMSGLTGFTRRVLNLLKVHPATPQSAASTVCSRSIKSSWKSTCFMSMVHTLGCISAVARHLLAPSASLNHPLHQALRQSSLDGGRISAFPQPCLRTPIPERNVIKKYASFSRSVSSCVHCRENRENKSPAFLPVRSRSYMRPA